jgi:hypothetical protein
MKIIRGDLEGVPEPTETTELKRISALSNQAISKGFLSREEDDQILKLVIANNHVTAQKCAAFRALQEKVWLAEIQLENLHQEVV